jgi:hypothetical protein
VWRCGRQFIRLFLQYLVISLVLLVVLLIALTLAAIPLPDLKTALVSALELAPRGLPWEYIRGYNGSLWYVRDYFSLLALVPLLVGVGAVYRIKYVVLLYVLVFTALFPKEYNSHLLFSTWGHVSCYLFFFLLGVIFREREESIERGSVAVSLLLAVGLSLVVYFSDGQHFYTDRYKFPPAMQYLIYSLPLVHVFVLLKQTLARRGFAFSDRAGRFLRWCGRNVFTLYLYQGAVCSLPYFYIDQLLQSVPPLLLYGGILGSNILLTIIIARLHVAAKKWCTSRVAVFLPLRESGGRQQ